VPRSERIMKKYFWFLIAVITLWICNACSSGTSATRGVSTRPATHFSVTAQGNSAVGQVFNFTVTALDASNNVVVNYSGIVQVTSSDPQAVLSPATSKLPNGSGTFSATLNTAGGQTITATDSVATSITGSSPSIDVSAVTVDHFSVTAPASATAGTSFNFTVSALDGSNNPLTSYSGTVSFTSSDSQASLPENSTLTNGTGSFSATMKTAGSTLVFAADTVTASMSGTSNPINVSPGTAAHFSVATPAYVNSGLAFALSVYALDAWNNVATSYSGVVHFTSSDGLAALPADTAVTSGGVGSSLTMNTEGVQTVSATDTVTAITGTSISINVLAPDQLAITSGQPPNGTVGTLYGESHPICVPPTTAINGFILEAAGGTITRKNPASWTSSPLPPGLQITSVTLTSSPQCFGTIWYIDGTPTTAGTFTFSLTATESTYSGTATYTITIAPASAFAPSKQEKPPAPAEQGRAEDNRNTEKDESQ